VSLVFLDTVGLLAVWDESDQWQAVATEALQRVTRSGDTMATTTFILLECGNAAARKPYRLAVDRLRHALEAAHCLVEPTNDEWMQAWEAFRRGDAGEAGIVDQFSFLVMRRLGITRAFTNDKHFEAAGFEVLF
jgi:predicted nucleic acid-binding protein